jgi:type I restriction enzyme, S subunit
MTWKPTLFSELAEFRNGLNFIKNDNGRTIKIIGVSDFKDYIELKSLDTLEQITIKGELKSEDLLQDDDLLFVRSNGNKKLIGRCMIIKVGNQEISYSGFTIRARLKSKEVLPRFLVQLFRSVYIKDQIQSVGGGTNISNLSQSILGDLKIPLPPLLEQCRIAEVLGVWDESIDLLEKLIGRVRSRKQGLMQQLLTGKKRFKEFEDSEWKEYQLSQIANITMGTSPKSESYNSKKEGLPLLQGNADIKNRVSAPRIWTNEITKECYPTDILISVRAPVGTIAISLHHACIGRGIASIKAKSEIISNYLYQLLLFHEPKWIGLSQGSTFDSVNSADIKSCLFSIPLMIPEQEKIAAVLSAADEEISTLEKQLAAYKQQKLGLMQQLLTGRIRI